MRTTSLIPERILNRKEAWLEGIKAMRERILTNLVMISQIPAETFDEKERADFLLERYLDGGLTEPYQDEVHNVVAVRTGTKRIRKILVSAHMDTIFNKSINHNVNITGDKVVGPGVADNSLGVAVLATLPEIIKDLDIEFESDLTFLSTVHSKEHGDLAGIRHFLKTNKGRLDYTVNVEGMTLGQVDHSSLSRVRCDIACKLEKSASNWGSSAIVVINEVVNQIMSIPLPQRPKTTLNIGKISGGRSYGSISREASLSIEVISEDDNVTDRIVEDIDNISVDVGARYGLELDVDFFSRYHAAGLSSSTPLVKNTMAIVRALGYKPMLAPAKSDITAPLSLGIPSINLGITTGLNPTSRSGYVDIEPISTGVLQLLMLLYAIDKGCCDEDLSAK